MTRLTDRRGRDIDVNGVQSRGHQPYEGLRYVPGFAQPPQQSRWEKLLRTLVRRPKNQNFRPQMVTELQPSRLEIELGKGLLDGTGAEIRQVAGHFHVLLAEKLEAIEVPFEPNDKWVRLTPDLEIQVREAGNAGSSFTYNIATRPQTERPLFSLSVGDPLPNRLVVGQEILGAQGNALSSFRMHSPTLPAHVGGIGSGSRPGGPMKKIRFTIAVNLRDYEIPFELKEIPLPHP